MRRLPDDRRWALALGALGVAVGVSAIGFRVAFVTDPLGPRAFPWLAAALLCAGGIGLWVEPGEDGPWPDRAARARLAAVMLSLVAWSILMPIMGFVPTTTVEIALLGRLFGARPVPGLASGLIVSGALWLLFGFGLGLPLPLGIWG